MIKALIEWLWVVLAATAAVWASVKAGIITLHLGPQGGAGGQLNSATHAEIDEAEEAHGEQLEGIKADAEVVRNASTERLAAEFDRAFGRVPKVDPFERGPDE